jgi:hypothetical protein
MQSLFHSRPLAEQALIRIGRETSASALSTTKYLTLREAPTECFEKIVVPLLSEEAHRELRRGPNPIQTFRKSLRRLLIAATLERIRARKAFAATKAAVVWLPSQAAR